MIWTFQISSSNPTEAKFLASGSELAVRWLFTSRRGGVSEPPFASLNLAEHVGDEPDRVRRNRDEVRQALGVASLVTMRPVHGAHVAVIEDDASPVEGVDALVTTRTDIALVAQGADCAPILMSNATTGVIAAVHCGWRGVVAGIVPATIESMTALGGPPTWCGIGPTICAGCYPVGDDVAAQVAAIGGHVATADNGQPAIDVRASVIDQLQGLGCRIDVFGGCTFEDSELFSYRRDSVTGRHGAAIALIPS